MKKNLRQEFELLDPLTVPAASAGVYFALIETGEVKIGCTRDIRNRLRAITMELNLSEEPTILAVLPGYREVESDLHARFVQYRSRSAGLLANELYRPEKPILDLIKSIRERGFHPAELEASLRPTLSQALHFDNGERLTFELTYLQFTETGELVPRYVLARRCDSCGRTLNSLSFLTRWSTMALGERAQHEYVVLESGERCVSCAPGDPFPSALAFVGGQTRLRLGVLLDRGGRTVEGFDRDRSEWLPLVRFGVRRMAKKYRETHPNDVATLRLQPYTSRHGLDRGRKSRA